MNSPSKLSDTQLIVLSVAAQTADRRVIMPERLRGGAADKLLAALIAKGLIEPIAKGRNDNHSQGPNIAGITNYCISAAGLARIGVSEVKSIPEAASMPEYVARSRARGAGDIASAPNNVAAGEQGHDSPSADRAAPTSASLDDHPLEPAAPTCSAVQKSQDLARQFAVGAAPNASRRSPRAGSKLDQVIGLLSSEAGATIDDLIRATGWLCAYGARRPHRPASSRLRCAIGARRQGTNLHLPDRQR